MFEQKNNPLLPSLKIEGHDVSYVPIEFFKNKQFLTTYKVEKFRIFRSSGTTEQEKSRVYFSDKGLSLYKNTAVKGFSDLLNNYLPDSQSRKIPGVSLIPTVEEWPHSSLAQMIQWFSESWKTQYASSTDFKEKLQFYTDRQQAVWIFATAYHLIKLYDQGFCHILYPGSLVIETGGAKGLARDVNPKLYQEMLCEMFQIKKERILSEYGMCELSSQAYSIYSKDGQFYFRFPQEVKTFVTRGLGEAHCSGRGALIVQDQSRYDCPWPIRTQDVVELLPTKEFRLIGRVPQSSLKGCSLLAQEVVGKDIRISHMEKPTENKTHVFCSTTSSPLERLARVREFVYEFFQKDEIKQLLTEDFYCPKIATQAAEDLYASFPKTKELWYRAIDRSQASSGDHWLLLIPNSHPFVFFYPFLLAYFSNLKITIRYSSAYDKKSIVGIFIEEFTRKFQYYCEALPSSFRISSNNDVKIFDGILGYGHTDTIRQLKQIVRVPINAYGHGVTVSVIHNLSDDTLLKALKDAFSLAQRGCFSSQMVLVATSLAVSPYELITRLLNLSEKFIQSSLPLMTSVALDHQSIKYCGNEYTYWQRTSEHDPLFPVFDYQMAKDQISKFLSSRSFVLPFVLCRQEELVTIIHQLQDVVLISRPEDISLDCASLGIDSCLLGTANRPQWSGIHQRKPLFSKGNLV